MQAVNSLHGQAVNSLPILCESNITQFHASASRLRKLLLALQAKRSFIVSRKETRLVRKNKRSTRLGRVVVALAKEAQGRLVFSRKGCFFKEGLLLPLQKKHKEGLFFQRRLVFSRKALPALLRLLEGAAVCPCLCFFFKHVSLEGVSRKGNQEQKIDYML